jgi:AcrR family transcriptional regulator
MFGPVPAPAPERVPRRERERRRHRQEILEAAKKVLADRGLAGVTVEHVAREADFAVGSIYRHFASKDSLIRELLVVVADEVVDECDAVGREAPDFHAHLERLVALLHARQLENLPLVQALMSAPGAFPAPGTPERQELEAVIARQDAVLDALIARGQAEGALPAQDRRPLVLALHGLLHAFGRGRPLGAPTVDGAAAHVVRLFLGAAGARV